MRRIGLLLVASLLAAGAARAHEARPGYLELRQTDDETYRLVWKQPARGELVLRLAPVLPDSCVEIGEGRRERVPGAMTTRSTVRCEGGLKDQTIRIAGLEGTLTDVLVRVHHQDGSEETHLARPVSPEVTISGSSRWQRAASYLRLGSSTS